MNAIERPDQYLRLRGNFCHYVRRVPKAVRHVDGRTLIYRSLDTDSRRFAKKRRDLQADGIGLEVAAQGGDVFAVVVKVPERGGSAGPGCLDGP